MYDEAVISAIVLVAVILRGIEGRFTFYLTNVSKGFIFCKETSLTSGHLISAFVVRSLDSIISVVAVYQIPSLYLVSGLSLTWSQTPKTGFLVTRLISLLYFLGQLLEVVLLRHHFYLLCGIVVFINQHPGIYSCFKAQIYIPVALFQL